MVPPPPESFNDQAFEHLIKDAIAAVKGGNRQQARRLAGTGFPYQRQRCTGMDMALGDDG